MEAQKSVGKPGFIIHLKSCLGRNNFHLECSAMFDLTASSFDQNLKSLRSSAAISAVLIPKAQHNDTADPTYTPVCCHKHLTCT